MVKIRKPKATVNNFLKTEPTKEEIEAFAMAADDYSSTKSKNKIFKSIRVSFSEHDYHQLDKASKKTGRTKLSFIRRAILEKADKALQQNELEID